MANKQNEHIRRSHLKLYETLEFLFEQGITVLSTKCHGANPVIRVQPGNTKSLKGAVSRNRIIDGMRVHEYQAAHRGCVIVWENIHVN